MSLVLLVKGEVFLFFVLGFALLQALFLSVLFLNHIECWLCFLTQTSVCLIDCVFQMSLSIHRYFSPFLWLALIFIWDCLLLLLLGLEAHVYRWLSLSSQSVFIVSCPLKSLFILLFRHLDTSSLLVEHLSRLALQHFFDILPFVVQVISLFSLQSELSFPSFQVSFLLWPNEVKFILHKIDPTFGNVKIVGIVATSWNSVIVLGALRVHVRYSLGETAPTARVVSVCGQSWQLLWRLVHILNHWMAIRERCQRLVWSHWKLFTGRICLTRSNLIE